MTFPEQRSLHSFIDQLKNQVIILGRENQRFTYKIINADVPKLSYRGDILLDFQWWQLLTAAITEPKRIAHQLFMDPDVDICMGSSVTSTALYHQMHAASCWPTRVPITCRQGLLLGLYTHYRVAKCRKPPHRYCFLLKRPVVWRPSSRWC